MKGFFKTFFACLAAMAAAAGALFLLMFVFFAAIAAMTQPQPEVRAGSVLVFDMSMTVQDRPVGLSKDAIVGQIMDGGAPRTTSLLTLTRGIRAAASDERIEGLLLTGSFLTEGYGSGFAALKEVRAAVLDFKESGKPVWGYTVYPSSRDLYVLSAADDVMMNPQGVISDTGMVMSYPFIGGFLEKYGVGVQVTRAGEYKAAAETFVREDMSAPSREANRAVLEDFWAEYLEALAEDSPFEAADYEAKLNELAMLTAEDAFQLGLVHRLGHLGEIVSELQQKVGRDDEAKTFLQTDIGSYLAAAVKPMYSSDGFIAVIYAEGSIVHGEGKEGEIGGTRLAREIRQARQDERVKGIVLRVNSPGGSALASENIQREIRLAKEKMPVIVSMGTLAASGGYWISAYSDRIFAQPNTLTGSIGVIGVFFNFGELAGKHGVNFDEVKTTQHADLMSPFRAKTEKEMALVQRQVDRVYDSFLDKVAEGRGLERDAVEALAGGRIWSGVDALRLGLVDELGGLNAAIAYAGQQAGLGQEPALLELPEAENFLDTLFSGGAPSTSDAQHATLKPLIEFYNEIEGIATRYNDPSGVYSVLPYTINVQ